MKKQLKDPPERIFNSNLNSKSTLQGPGEAGAGMIVVRRRQKETSILKLNIKDKNPRKNINILNKLTEIYIRTGLDEKNIMATNTIYFIDEQLNEIRDSLKFIENQLEVFKLQNPNIEIVDKEF